MNVRHVNAYLWRPGEGIRSSGSGFNKGCELSEVPAGNETQVP